MSWLKDEWKDGLPSNALLKISQLEEQCERLAKDKKSLQFQIDTLKSSLDNSRVTEEKLIKEKQGLDRKLETVTDTLNETNRNLENAQASLKEKTFAVFQLKNDVTQLEKERNTEIEKRLDIEKQNERLLNELLLKEEELDKASTELEMKFQSSMNNEEIMKDEMESEGFEHQKLMEENYRLKEERALEREGRCEAERALHGTDYIDINSKTNTLRRRIAKKEQETRELYERITQLESVLRSSNLNEVNFDRNSESSTEKFSGLDLVESGIDKDSAEFVRKISVMKFQIYDLEKENEDLRAAVNDQKTRTLSAERVSKVNTESLRQSLTELDEQLAEVGKARKGIEKQLHDEREMFMVSEHKMKTEIENLKEEMKQYKEHWQEEREAFLEQERKMKEMIKEFEKGEDIPSVICKKSNTSLMQTLETEKLNLSDRVTSLSAKVESLECMKISLENENAHLLNEILNKSNQSIAKGNMKEAKDSLKECAQEQINRLEWDLEMRDKNIQQMQKESEGLQGHIDELYNELDEVNKILADEREKRKNLEVESLEFKKKERVYENAIAASMEGTEKKMLSSFVKKRGERWNNDVVDLRKKIEELERKNKELSNAMDRRSYSVEAIKQGFENKLKEEQSKKAFGTPERSSSSKELVLKSSNYCTPISRSSSRHTNDSVSIIVSDLEQTDHSKEALLSQLQEQVKAAETEKDKAKRISNAKIKALEEEVALLRQHVQGITNIRKVGNFPNTMITPKAFKGELQTTESQEETWDNSSKRQPNVSMPRTNWNTLDELKDLVVEYTSESSELQEIVDESKEAIYELKKALQGNEGLFLVDSANMEEIKKVASLSNGDLDDFVHIDKKGSHAELVNQKQYSSMPRLSLADIDVEAMLSKLRIAVNQLESRLEKVISDKERVQTTIQTMEKDSSLSLRSISKSFEEIINKKYAKDSGLMGNRSAVIDIARERDAIITDGTIDEIAHEENTRPEDEKAFQHGQRCKLLWQQLCDAMASLSKYEKEAKKSKQQKISSEKQTDEGSEREQKGGIEDMRTQMEDRVSKEELEEKENTIRCLESQLFEEKRSFQLLQEEVENYRINLDESKEKNYKLTEKLEELRTVLYKHHKSSDKKLDSILNLLQEGLMGQVRNMVESDFRRKTSPTEFRVLSHSNSKQSSRNASFYSAEDGNCTELVGKKSNQRRHRKDSYSCRAISPGYETIDEIERVKGKMSWIQDHVKGLVGCIDEAKREKYKVQEECKQLLQRMEEKDAQMKKAEANLELERHRMSDNDTEYRAELDALKTEQLEVFQEFREICETVKRKDVELLNKSKQIKLLTAEWKEKETNLMTHVDNLERENKALWTENSELRVEVERSKNITDEFTRKMKNSEDNLNQLYQKLSQVDTIFYECKQKGLYK